MTETPDIRRKRLYMRASHRGIKEMDLILGGWAKENLPNASEQTLDLFESLLPENDHDLYQWVSGQMPPPPQHAQIIGILSDYMRR
jgi:antitoxin CptB